MKSFSLLALAISAGVAFAAPRPIPFAQDLADTVELVETQPGSTGPTGPPVGIDAPPPLAPSESEIIADANDNFVTNADSDVKVKKRALPPAGYYTVFEGLSGATQHPSYITFKSFPTYDPVACTNFCNSIAGCVFANLYIEHVDAQAPQPSSASAATNEVFITDSNGYSKKINPEIAGWNEEELNAAINGKRANPTDPDPYMGMTTIEAVSKPSLCKDLCEQKTAYNSRHPTDGKYRACNFFNFYLLFKNGEGYKTVCSFYIIPFNSSYATNTGYTSSGNVYTVHDSWSFTREQLLGEGGIVTI
ncbi:hypothetical protein BDZ91DRAFT_750646 [Kalaharituber pfeilii]|nr:hypothetical protein BDZ91DRAFT_750646 [Kalaharituber pfeilii]